MTPTQLGYLDTTSSVQTQINSKQATLSAARLAVCDGDVFTSANYSTTTAMNSALANKQDTLSAARLAVCDGDVFTSASYSTAVTVNSALALKAPLDDPSFTGSIEINGTALTSTAAELNYCDGVTSAIQTQLDAKQDTQTFAASRAIVSGQNGELQNSTVTSAEILHLDGVTSSIQVQLDAKQAALTRTNIGTVTWSSGPQTATIANVTAKRGYFVVVPTLNQPTIQAAQRTLEVTIEIASLAETDMVIVPDSQMSNHSGGAINISHARPNSDLGTIRIKLRSAASVDYTGNTADKFFVSYLVL